MTSAIFTIVVWSLMGLVILLVVPAYLASDTGRFVKKRSAAVSFVFASFLLLYLALAFAGPHFRATRGFSQSMLSFDFSDINCGNLSKVGEQKVRVNKPIYFHGQELTAHTSITPGKFDANQQDLFQAVAEACPSLR